MQGFNQFNVFFGHIKVANDLRQWELALIITYRAFNALITWSTSARVPVDITIP